MWLPRLQSGGLLHIVVKLGAMWTGQHWQAQACLHPLDCIRCYREAPLETAWVRQWVGLDAHACMSDWTPSCRGGRCHLAHGCCSQTELVCCSLGSATRLSVVANQPCAVGWQPWHRATTRNGRQARSWDQGANNLGRNACAHPKHTSAFGAEMCGVGGPISDASTGRANAL
jgi:hypothetical protein